jgi:hypothetical protein
MRAALVVWRLCNRASNSACSKIRMPPSMTVLKNTAVCWIASISTDKMRPIECRASPVRWVNTKFGVVTPAIQTKRNRIWNPELIIAAVCNLSLFRRAIPSEARRRFNRTSASLTCTINKMTSALADTSGRAEWLFCGTFESDW